MKKDYICQNVATKDLPPSQETDVRTSNTLRLHGARAQTSGEVPSQRGLSQAPSSFLAQAWAEHISAEQEFN